MAKRSYTDEEKQAALRLYETHGPTAVEKQLGIPKNTVASWAKASKVRTVRTVRTQHAVEAVQVDNKLRRQNIAARLYGQAEVMLTDLEAPTFRTLVRGEGGAEYERTLDFIPSGERRTLIQATGAALKTTQELEQRDQDGGQTAAVSMLDKLAKQLMEVDVVDPPAGEQSGFSGSSESEAAALPVAE